MAYTILNTDGTTLLLLANNTVDTLTTSLTLIGKNTNYYGESLNNNLIKLLANNATAYESPPNNPLTGQLWYDTTNKQLKIYDTTFKIINGATISSTIPAAPSLGEMWWDSINKQLKIYTSTGFTVAGPQFPNNIGENGWVLPGTPIKDTNSNIINVTLLKNFGSIIGSLSTVSTDILPADAATYFNQLSMSLAKGLTIVGDIKFTGRITNKTLSMTVNLLTLTASIDFSVQNTAIINLLTKVFPISGTSTDTRVFPDSEARVVCEHNGVYEVRRFHIVSSLWTPYNFTTNNLVT